MSPAEYEELIDARTPLACWRKHRGLTQSALAQAVGVSQVAIANLEMGNNTPSTGTCAKLARVLRVRMEDLLTED